MAVSGFFCPRFLWSGRVGFVRRMLVWCVASGVVVVSLAGCSEDGNDGDDEFTRDMSAKAQVDYERGTVTTPITPYLLPWRLTVKAAAVMDLMVKPCMKVRGFDHQMISLDGGEGRSRLWGLWSVEDAQKYGYGLSPSGEDGESRSTSDGYQEARSECGSEKAREYRALLGETMYRPYRLFSTKISGGAKGLAEKTEEFRVVRAEFDRCLRDAGFVPDPDTPFAPKHPDFPDSGGPSAEEIRTAVAEARCMDQARVVQRMSDVMASYEAPLVEKHQAVLNTERDKLTEAEKRIDDYIRTHR